MFRLYVFIVQHEQNNDCFYMIKQEMLYTSYRA